MFLVGSDQNDMKVSIAIRHIVALVEHEAVGSGGVLTQVFTTGQLADDVQSFYLKMTRDEAMAEISRGLN
ncbi:hypothetical protein [Kaistia sp. MMO-174]|uniref:hypothetical protein n=1 Tax=Kaistia sp. MMO-174 TaxID=3081256 RepID=UPI003016E2AD